MYIENKSQLWSSTISSPSSTESPSAFMEADIFITIMALIGVITCLVILTMIIVAIIFYSLRAISNISYLLFKTHRRMSAAGSSENLFKDPKRSASSSSCERAAPIRSVQTTDGKY